MIDLRIVFMGTPDFAVGILSNLVAEEFNIVGVITAPDRPAGRGQKMKASAVKKFALKKGLKVLQPTNLKNQDFLNELGALQANLQIVVAFRMLPKVVWELPSLGTFNLHASLLPDYRGAAPINWAIINGETKTGTTTFFIDEKIDTGAIILQNEIDISEKDTAGDLHDKLMELGSDLVLKTVKLIENGNVKTQQQPFKEDKDGKSPYKHAPKIYKNTCKIDWQQPIGNIYNKIRGLNPYPGAWTLIENDGETLEAKIYLAEKEIDRHNKPIGKVITTKKELKVAVKNGYIKVHEIKLSGKRKMAVVDLLNGYAFKEGAMMC